MEENKPNPTEIKEKKSIVYYMLFQLGMEFAVILALPLIAFIYAGKYMERRYHSKLYIVAGILLALTLSSYMIYRKISDVKKLMK